MLHKRYLTGPQVIINIYVNIYITCIFLLSVMAQIQTRRRKVPRNWSKIPPAMERCDDGNVENIPEVSGMERYTARSCSYLKSLIRIM
jgi:hypothetical protein